jgi:hypothetical protein
MARHSDLNKNPPPLFAAVTRVRRIVAAPQQSREINNRGLTAPCSELKLKWGTRWD